jgi:hypothetical protein
MLLSICLREPGHEKLLDPPRMVVELCLVGLLAAAPTVAAYSWRVRVDRTGVHRTFLHFFRRTWTWDSFRARKILYRGRKDDKEHVGFTYSLLLTEEDIDQILAIADTVWVPPDLPSPLPRLELKHRAKVRRRPLVFDEHGIDAVVDGTPRSYSWSEVKSAVLTRGNRREQGFRRCRLELPHGTLILEGESDRPNWQGADDRMIEAFLRTNLPPEKLSTGAYHDDPQTLTDYDVRIDRIESHLREWRLFNLVAVAAPVAFVVWMLYQVHPDWTWWNVVILSIMLTFLLLVPGIPAVTVWQQRRELKELKVGREAFLDRSNPHS